MKRGLYIKKSKKGWVWNAVAKNGRIVGNGELFKTKENARKGLAVCFRTFILAFDSKKDELRVKVIA